MICTNCLKEIADGSNFCYNCGARLSSASPAAAAAPVSKRLMRSSTDKRIAGVCAGVADYFDMDPTLVRVLWALATLVPGPNIIVYVILWIVLPLAPPIGIPATAQPTATHG